MRYSASTGHDFTRATKTNVRVDERGHVRLSGVNLLSDPRLEDITPSGELVHWDRLKAPPTPNGRHIYIGKKAATGAETSTRQTRQLDKPLDRSIDSYTQVLKLITGAPLPNAKSTQEAVKQTVAPVVSSVIAAPGAGGGSGGATGYPGGVYPMSYAWVIGDIHDPARRWFTNPAPSITFTLAEGQSYELVLPREVPNGVPGMAILQGKPGGSPTELYVQDILDVGSYIPATVIMDGPLKQSFRAPATNQTYIGAYNQWPSPRERMGSGWATLLNLDTELTYRFRTEFGLSASQNLWHCVKGIIRPRTFIYYVFPQLHSRALSIFPQIQGPNGQWYVIDYGLGGGDVPIRGFEAYFTTDDPEKVNTGTSYQSSERTEIDETGIPGPDEALQIPRTYGSARISAGDYVVRATDVYTSHGPIRENREAAPSAPASVTLAAGQARAILIDFREGAEEGDVTPNGDFASQNNNGTPRRFTIPSQATSGVGGVNPQDSTVSFSDTSSRTTTDIFFQSDPFTILPTAQYSARAGFEITSRTGGAVEVALQWLGALDAVIGENRIAIQRQTDNLDPRLTEVSIGISGNLGGADVGRPASTLKARWIYRMLGGAQGNRNVTGKVIHAGLFLGLAVPNKHDAPNPVDDLEPNARPYPGGSYSSLITAPAWANGKGNGFEYYGSSRALLRPSYFAGGLRLPVDPGVQHTIQCDYELRGTAPGSMLHPVTVTDDQGKTVASFTALRPDAASPGTSTGTASRTFTVPQDGSYVELGYCTLGAGRVRTWGYMLSVGSTVQTWTNAIPASGTIVCTLDTQNPGFATSSALPAIFDPNNKIPFIDGGAIADEPSGTSVALQYRSRAREADPWSPYRTTLASLTPARFVEITATLSTNSPGQGITPEIDELFIEATPPRPVLLTGQGTVYPGGVLVDKLPAESWADNTERTPRQDGYDRLREITPPRRILESITLRTFSDKAAAAVSYNSTHGNRRFVIEGAGMRYLVHLINVRFQPERADRVAGANCPHITKDLIATVISAGPLE